MHTTIYQVGLDANQAAQVLSENMLNDLASTHNEFDYVQNMESTESLSEKLRLLESFESKGFIVDYNNCRFMVNDLHKCSDEEQESSPFFLISGQLMRNNDLYYECTHSAPQQWYYLGTCIDAHL